MGVELELEAKMAVEVVAVVVVVEKVVVVRESIGEGLNANRGPAWEVGVPGPCRPPELPQMKVCSGRWL